MLERLQGQHVYLFTKEDTLPFCETLGFNKQGVGLAIVISDWWVNDPQ